MDERADESSAKILQEFFPDNDLRTAVKLFIDAVSQVDGLSELILYKYQTGILRFYVIWENETWDRTKVGKLWEDSFANYSSVGRGDLLVIQYPKSEFVKIIAESQHFNYGERVGLWKR